MNKVIQFILALAFCSLLACQEKGVSKKSRQFKITTKTFFSAKDDKIDSLKLKLHYNIVSKRQLIFDSKGYFINKNDSLKYDVELNIAVILRKRFNEFTFSEIKEKTTEDKEILIHNFFNDQKQNGTFFMLVNRVSIVE